jgi:hypothetical protein
MNNGDLVLSEQSILSFPGSEAGKQLYCVDGLLWVTRAGDASDHVLRPGDGFSLAEPGRVVIESLRVSTVRLRSA